MDTTKKTFANSSISAVVALLVTTVLFVGIPLLTRLSQHGPREEVKRAILISQTKPPPPPEPEKQEKVEKKELKKDVKKEKAKEQRSQPKRNFQLSGLGGNVAGTINVGGLLNTKFEVSDSLFVTAFNLNEVDQKPSVVRMMNPRYPFEAKSKGINGKVMLRFVVDSNGDVKEPEVEWAKPEDVFDEAALEAIARFKFRPAKKGGVAVDCIVRQPLTFDVTE